MKKNLTEILSKIKYINRKIYVRQQAYHQSNDNIPPVI